MYSTDQNYSHPAVPPLYPMDPCKPMPSPYNPAPTHPHMPSCPMMDPQFRDCVKVCMMRCGSYPKPMESSMYMDYHHNFTVEPNEFNSY